MLSLSTALLSTDIEHGRLILEAMEKFDIQGLELDCRVNRSQLAQVKVSDFFLDLTSDFH